MKKQDSNVETQGVAGQTQVIHQVTSNETLTKQDSIRSHTVSENNDRPDGEADRKLQTEVDSSIFQLADLTRTIVADRQAKAAETRARELDELADAFSDQLDEFHGVSKAEALALIEAKRNAAASPKQAAESRSTAGGDVAAPDASPLVTFWDKYDNAAVLGQLSQKWEYKGCWGCCCKKYVVPYGNYEYEPSRSNNEKPNLVAADQLRRRLAAIPVSGSTAPLEVQQVDVESSSLSVPLLGSASAALVCIGCALRRRFMQLKRRDSFGFLADSQRPSLNAAELAV